MYVCLHVVSISAATRSVIWLALVFSVFSCSLVSCWNWNNVLLGFYYGVCRAVCLFRLGFFWFLVFLLRLGFDFDRHFTRSRPSYYFGFSCLPR